MNISTSVLDFTLGRPVCDMVVSLEHRTVDGWRRFGSTHTDTHGTARDWGAVSPEPGIYRLVFDTGDYFAANGVSSSYPEIVVTLLADDEPVHVPLLLGPHAYSTYLSKQ